MNASDTSSRYLIARAIAAPACALGDGNGRSARHGCEHPTGHGLLRPAPGADLRGRASGAVVAYQLASTVLACK